MRSSNEVGAFGVGDAVGDGEVIGACEGKLTIVAAGDGNGDGIWDGIGDEEGFAAI